MADTYLQQSGGYPYLELPPRTENSPPYPYGHYLQARGEYPKLPLPDVIRMSEPVPYLMYSQNSGVNNGYPYLAFLGALAKIAKPVRQREYIQVYEMKVPQNEFDRNGARILTPTRCEITETFDEYELTIEHPLDSLGNWKFIVEFNIIKACKQLFRIYRVVSDYEETGTITAYARHISYEMADGMVYEMNTVASGGADALSKIIENTQFYPDTYSVNYHFNLISDIDKECKLQFKNVTPIDAIMGTDASSLVSQLGGEVVRDNFNFKLLKKAGSERAFDLRIGFNMTGIHRDIDYSSFATMVKFSSEGLLDFMVSYADPEHLQYPHHIVRHMRLSYNNPTSYEQFMADALAIWDGICVPKYEYTFKIKDLRLNPDYADFVEYLPEFNLGDGGTIYDTKFDSTSEQRVYKRTIDAIKGEIVDVTFTNKLSSLTRKTRYSNNITDESNPAETLAEKLAKEMHDMKRRLLVNWSVASGYTWEEIKEFEWQELK